MQILLTQVQKGENGGGGDADIADSGSKGEKGGGGDADIADPGSKGENGGDKMRTFLINFGWRART